MKIRHKIAALSLVVLLPATVACTADATTSTGTSETSTSESSDSPEDRDLRSQGDEPGVGGGPGADVDASSVTTEDQLVTLIQAAYGEASLGLHRGHQPVQDVLDEVLTISHDELHVRMEEQGQNLAAVATDLDIDPATLVDALVDSWSPAVDNLLDAGTITEEQAEDYTAALEEAFTFRVTWDGEEATPAFSGIDA